MKKLAILIVVFLIGGIAMGEPNFFSFTGGVPLANGRMKAPGIEGFYFNFEEILLSVKGISEKVLIDDAPWPPWPSPGGD